MVCSPSIEDGWFRRKSSTKFLPEKFTGVEQIGNFGVEFREIELSKRGAIGGVGTGTSRRLLGSYL